VYIYGLGIYSRVFTLQERCFPDLRLLDLSPILWRRILLFVCRRTSSISVTTWHAHVSTTSACAITEFSGITGFSDDTSTNQVSSLSLFKLNALSLHPFITPFHAKGENTHPCCQGPLSGTTLGICGLMHAVMVQSKLWIVLQRQRAVHKSGSSCAQCHLVLPPNVATAQYRPCNM
jgi:hypothetical protein